MTIAALEFLSFGLARMAEAADAAGHRLVLLTGDRGVYRHELATLPEGAIDVVDVDTGDPAAVREVLAGLPELAGLVNTTDTWSLPAAELARELGLPGPRPELVRGLRDKAWVRRTLHREGLSRGSAVVIAAGETVAPENAQNVQAETAHAEPVPEEAVPEEVVPEEAVRRITADVGLPAVLKDSAGTSSRAVWIVRDERELRAALAEAAELPLTGELFAEPFLAGPLYSAETLSWEGETRLLGVSSRQTSRTPAVREEGAAFPVALPPAELSGIERWVARVLAAAGHDQGFAHVEFVLTAEGPELVEINRRLGGALVAEALCRNLRANVYEAMVAVTLGERPGLLDAPAAPEPGPAVAFVLVYAETPGVLLEWTGVEGLGAFPGAVEWYPVRVPGDSVPTVLDQRGCTGMVLAHAPTAELAQHRAWSAATSVRPVMKTAGAL
ncbi:ATP-grasp domain-containing protein [Streptomyces sp. NPDC057638]|uniref:ATP-grasp domain-containing protein n=1 Tax=Streptomyces sp. NPDC057638 TaxID=3346190 RepID=UPI0036B8C3E3